MKKTTTTFITQLETLFKDYDNYCGASALFYKGHNSSGITTYGLRMEAPSIAREFTSNVYFGSDPEGLLFYHTLSDFNPINSGKDTKYHCFYNTENTVAVKINFHAMKANGRDEEPNPFCTFITRHTDGLTREYLENEGTNDGTGEWHDALTAAAYAKAHKNTTSKEITVTMSPIGKQIYFDTDKDVNGAIDLTGTFTYLDAKKLNVGEDKLLADYDMDRIVFYDPNDKKKMIGFFIPVQSMSVLQNTEATKQKASIKNI